jgi:hypothetical protein
MVGNSELNRLSPDKRDNRTREVLVRHLSGNATYQDLARLAERLFTARGQD